MRVDGPYSTPTEHFKDYNAVMLIGAGIGANLEVAICC